MKNEININSSQNLSKNKKIILPKLKNNCESLNYNSLSYVDDIFNKVEKNFTNNSKNLSNEKQIYSQLLKKKEKK